MTQMFDRRQLLGTAGALTLLTQPAAAQGANESAKNAKDPEAAEAKRERQTEVKPQTADGGRLSDIIADFVIGFHPAAVPAVGIERMRLAFVDTLAVMLAGSREHGTELVCEMVRQEGAAPKVAVVGQSLRTSPQLAALANGVAAHIMDYDLSSMLGQPSSPIIPALLPLAESTGATPAEVTAAFMVGFELCMRFARAVPEQSSIAGWHAVSSIGTMGAAMACARLLKAPRETIPDILGIAASLSGGLSANFGTMTKPLHSGTSARNAILAASLGRSGFTANAIALEHPASGYFRAFDRDMKVSFAPFEELGHSFDIVERGFKPKRYPCGGLGHAAIDATLELRNEVRIADIVSIKAGITRYASLRIGDKYPTSIENAKFSMPYVAAYTALYGAPMLKAFTEEAIGDPAVKALAAKVSVAVDPEYADLLDDSPARIIVTLADGRTIERTRYYASGTPQVPLTREQVEEKFFSCAERSVDKAAAARIFVFLNRIDQEASFAELWGLVKRA
jgi:2-methylcitrate dehydratase PrpD